MDTIQKVAFTTLGCKLNFSETSGIANQFESAGYMRVSSDQNADIYVINTCTVTELANKKSKQAIKKLIHQNPDAKIIAIGCYSQLKPDEVAQIEGVHLVLGSANKFNVVDEIKHLEKGNAPKVLVNDSRTDNTFTPTYSYGDRTRSFLKVQDGCDYFCSYCAIPNARGKSRNNTIAETIIKANELVSKGIREIILTGVNIGDFGKATNESFYQLVQQLEQVNGLERLRISSIEPNLLTDEIITYVQKSKVILPHFHIPLQCGTNNLLRLMRRRYTIQFYKKKVDLIKSIMPHACIAADIIVGVPGETDEEFMQTCSYINSLNIAYLHVFTYSERDNTAAVKMENQVPVEVRKNRSKIMHQIASQKQLAFFKEHLNTIRKVLFEGQNFDGLMYGFTDNYIKVEIPFNHEFINTTQNVLLELITDNYTVKGKIVAYD